MTAFKINERYTIVCEWKKTRNAFKHTATLIDNGNEIEKVKICYQNRTWESFEFESVICKLLEKTNILTGEEIKEFIKLLSEKDTEAVNALFGAIGMVAKLGEVFTKTKAEANDWKKRMIQAGLGASGLTMPEDWDSLTEDVKEIRLNGIINMLNENK
jgi:hypothetical protein